MSQTPNVNKALGHSRFASSTAPTSVMSKTFENYIKARENAERIAKEKVDKLNNDALLKVKHQKLAEKVIRNQTTTRHEAIEAHKEKLKAAKHRKDQNLRAHLDDAEEYFEAWTQGIDDRKQ